MLEYFFYHYSMIPENVEGFKLYGSLHITWLCCLFMAGLVCCDYYKKQLNPQQRLKFRKIMTDVMWIAEIVKNIIIAATGNFDASYLPFHLCGIGLTVSFIQAHYNNETCSEIMYGLCMPGALAALLFPNWTAYPLMNFMHMHSFIIHGMLMLYPILMMTAKEYRPNYRNIKKLFAFILAIAAPLYVFNKIFNTNFLFVNWPSEGSPLVLFEKWFGNPGYLVPFFGLLLLVWVLMYFPFYLKDRKMQRSALAKD